jgi:hypothetical protein
MLFCNGKEIFPSCEGGRIKFLPLESKELPILTYAS